MIVFLYGPDDYRREEKKRSIRQEFLKKHSSLSVGRFDVGEKEEVAEFENFVKSQSIFESKKLVFPENVFESTEREKLIDILQALVKNKNVTAVLSERDKPVKAFAFLLEKPVLSQEFRKLEGSEWERFITNVAKQNGVTLEPGALELLARTYAGNSWGVVTEIEKLALLKKIIAKTDVENSVLETLPDFWAIFGGLKHYDVSRRLLMLEKLFAANEPAAKVFNILASMWKERVGDFAEYDLKVKSGKLDYEEALLDSMLK